MDKETMRKLKLDRRLIGRRGWISEDELHRELEALPDASDKILPPEPPEAAEPSSSEAEGD